MKLFHHIQKHFFESLDEFMTCQLRSAVRSEMRSCGMICAVSIISSSACALGFPTYRSPSSTEVTSPSHLDMCATYRHLVHENQAHRSLQLRCHIADVVTLTRIVMPVNVLTKICTPPLLSLRDFLNVAHFSAFPDSAPPWAIPCRNRRQQTSTRQIHSRALKLQDTLLLTLHLTLNLWRSPAVPKSVFSTNFANQICCGCNC